MIVKYVKMQILLKFGGIMVDTDNICLRPLDEVAYRYKFVVGLAPYNWFSHHPETNLGFIAAESGHPILKLASQYFL